MPSLATSLTAGTVTVEDLVTIDDATIGDDLVVTDAATAASFNGLAIESGSADPSAGAGVAATQPALYFRTGTDQVWLNNGAGDTAWTRLATGVDTALLAPLASPTFTGAVTSPRYVATSNGAVTSGQESYEISGRGGIYSAGASTISLTGGGVLSALVAGGLLQVNGQVYAGTVTTTGALRLTAQTAFAAVTTVLAYTGTYQPVTLTAGAVVNAATPSISGGSAGDILILRGTTGAGTYAIQDKGTLASSGLSLITTSVVIGIDDEVMLLCTAANTWKQLTPVADNI